MGISEGIQNRTAATNRSRLLSHLVRTRRIHLILGGLGESLVLRPKGIGGRIIRHDTTLSLYPALEFLPNVGGILLGNRASCQRHRQSAQKKSHISHTMDNKKADL